MQDPSIIQPRVTRITLPNGSDALALVMRGGGYSRPGTPSSGATKDPSIIQPRETIVKLPDGTVTWAVVMRGGGYSRPGAPTPGALQDPSIIQPRDTIVTLPDSSLAHALVLRGGAWGLSGTDTTGQIALAFYPFSGFCKFDSASNYDDGPIFVDTWPTGLYTTLTESISWVSFSGPRSGTRVRIFRPWFVNPDPGGPGNYISTPADYLQDDSTGNGVQYHLAFAGGSNTVTDTTIDSTFYTTARPPADPDGIYHAELSGLISGTALASAIAACRSILDGMTLPPFPPDAFHQPISVAVKFQDNGSIFGWNPLPMRNGDFDATLPTCCAAHGMPLRRVNTASRLAVMPNSLCEQSTLDIIGGGGSALPGQGAICCAKSLWQLKGTPPIFRYFETSTPAFYYEFNDPHLHTFSVGWDSAMGVGSVSPLGSFSAGASASFGPDDALAATGLPSAQIGFRSALA